MADNGWIPVTVHLPENARDVLVLEDGRQFVTWYGPGTKLWDGRDDCHPSHWHELLPEPDATPKPEEKAP